MDLSARESPSRVTFVESAECGVNIVTAIYARWPSTYKRPVREPVVGDLPAPIGGPWLALCHFRKSWGRFQRPSSTKPTAAASIHLAQNLFELHALRQPATFDADPAAKACVDVGFAADRRPAHRALDDPR